jgi:hypothetical protein
MGGEVAGSSPAAAFNFDNLPPMKIEAVKAGVQKGKGRAARATGTAHLN